MTCKVYIKHFSHCKPGQADKYSCVYSKLLCWNSSAAKHGKITTLKQNKLK